MLRTFPAIFPRTLLLPFTVELIYPGPEFSDAHATPEVMIPMELRTQQRQEGNESYIALLVLTLEVLVVVVVYGVGFAAASPSASSGAMSSP